MVAFGRNGEPIVVVANDNHAPVNAHLGFVFRPEIIRVGEKKRGAIIFGTQKAISIGNSFSVETMRSPDLDSFRLATFFFDLIDTVEFHGPQTNFFPDFGASQFGLTHKTTVTVQGDGMKQIADIPFALLMVHEYYEKGLWTIWHEHDFEPIPEDYSVPDTAFKLRIQNALVVPHREVPFEDVLQFKEQRRSELLKLHFHLEDLCMKVAKSPNDEQVFRLEAEKFDLAVSDYLKVIKERNWRKSLANLDVRMDWMAVGGATLATANASAPLPMSTNILAALTPLLAGSKLQSIFGNEKKMDSPFAYLGHIVANL